MIQKYGLYVVWVIASLGFLTSIYLNLSSPFDWGQRACLFPLVFIAGMAAWRGFLGIASYLLPQTFIGLCLAVYQFLLAIGKISAFFSESPNNPWVCFSFLLVFFSLFVLLMLLSNHHARRIIL
ncbi:MAG: hypothetical protein IT584_00450 [Chlamydiae bacterium]|nr:hypothetical protein [Chlamydiota bacterium]